MKKLEKEVAMQEIEQYIEERLKEIKKYGRDIESYRHIIYEGGNRLEEAVLLNFKAQHKVMQYQQAIGKEIGYTLGNDLWMDDELVDHLSKLVDQKWKEMRPDELGYQ